MRLVLEYFNLSMLSVPSPTLSDYIDILIVAYLIYKVTMWIKDTRAWILFKGFAILLVIQFSAHVMQLNTIAFIINNTFSVGVIAIIVIMQPEIRKALEQLGTRKIFPNNFFTTEPIDQVKMDAAIEEIITATFKMAEMKTGALIVVEKETTLEDWQKTGIAIDALVSSQLLINIFENKTPLHDGAVIIRKGRIVSATCILPLTQKEMSSEYGTRHRAAIGSSEQSDACIVVVSEESGKISVAKGGKFSRDISKDSLRSVLSGEKILPKRKKYSVNKKGGVRGEKTGGKNL